MSPQTHITVAAVIESSGRFLVVEERIDGRLVLNQPAGHVEDRETLVDAVIRETREETAWGFAPTALLGTYRWRNPQTHASFLRFAFLGEVRDHRPDQPLDRDIVRATWLTRDEIVAAENRLRSPLVLRCIDDYLTGQQFALDSVAHVTLQTAPHVSAVISL
jgi:8-oxo-dGTP pyrophosphatase MutT (NUDIX family)